MYPPQTSSESHGAGVNSFFFKKKTQKIIAKKFPEARVNMLKKKN
jgi:hypothetical protein